MHQSHRIRTVRTVPRGHDTCFLRQIDCGDREGYCRWAGRTTAATGLEPNRVVLNRAPCYHIRTYRMHAGLCLSWIKCRRRYNRAVGWWVRREVTSYFIHATCYMSNMASRNLATEDQHGHATPSSAFKPPKPPAPALQGKDGPRAPGFPRGDVVLKGLRGLHRTRTPGVAGPLFGRRSPAGCRLEDQ